MRLLVASSIPDAADRMVRRVNVIAAVKVEKVASDLTQVYDFAEHRKPDCVILSAELVGYPEFELLRSLLKILRIGCVIVGAERNIVNSQKHLAETEGFVCLPEDALTEDALRQVQDSRYDIRGLKQDVGSVSPARTDYDRKRLLLIGASTGGVDALLEVLRCFPTDCPPTMIVQHTGGRFSQSLIRLLNGCTVANVGTAVDGSIIEAGNVYLAPDDSVHLQIQPTRIPRILLSEESPKAGHRPSIDALFGSALHMAKNVTAALLTGMGRDGARGIADLRRAGAQTIGQDEKSCVVYGMPRVAAQLGGLDQVLPLEKIGPALLRSAEMRTRV